MRAFIAVLVAILSIAGTSAWWCTGHMIVAQIALNHMTPAAQQQVSGSFASLSKSGPFPMAADMVEGACWADDLKSDHLVSMATWHFINQPYSPTGVKPKSNPIQKENVASVITQLDKTAHHQKFPWILNFAVANLVHFIGDIHQPLHAATLFNAEFPNGDEGGNLYLVSINGTQTHLHFIWDSVCWQWTEPLARPLNTQNRTWVENMATKLVQKYNISAADRTTWNSTVMAEESLADAIKYAYGGAPPVNGAITEKYIETCIPVAETRLVMAGWRLASELNYLFKDGEQADPEDLAEKVNFRLEELKKASKQHA